MVFFVCWKPSLLYYFPMLLNIPILYAVSYIAPGARHDHYHNNYYCSRYYCFSHSRKAWALSNHVQTQAQRAEGGAENSRRQQQPPKGLKKREDPGPQHTIPPTSLPANKNTSAGAKLTTNSPICMTTTNATPA